MENLMTGEFSQDVCDPCRSEEAEEEAWLQPGLSRGKEGRHRPPNLRKPISLPRERPGCSQASPAGKRRPALPPHTPQAPKALLSPPEEAWLQPGLSRGKEKAGGAAPPPSASPERPSLSPGRGLAADRPLPGERGGKRRPAPPPPTLRKPRKPFSLPRERPGCSQASPGGKRRPAPPPLRKSRKAFSLAAARPLPGEREGRRRPPQPSGSPERPSLSPGRGLAADRPLPGGGREGRRAAPPPSLGKEPGLSRPGLSQASPGLSRRRPPTLRKPFSLPRERPGCSQASPGGKRRPAPRPHPPQAPKALLYPPGEASRQPGLSQGKEKAATRPPPSASPSLSPTRGCSQASPGGKRSPATPPTVRKSRKAFSTPPPGIDLAAARTLLGEREGRLRPPNLRKPFSLPRERPGCSAAAPHPPQAPKALLTPLGEA
ncbi:uncharacterized protein LOC143831174 [Paroedura picta]|uniref:uncharacterized protein LOC143831174 n=1 Tax=Paroedura picta TaxID=143630 RepID=UPI00405788A2